MKPLKILMITPFFSPNVGGIETHLNDLIEYLEKRNHKVSVITYQPLTTKVKAPKLEKKKNLEINRMGWFGYNWFHRLEPYPFLEFLYLFPGLFVYSLLFLLRRKKEIDTIHGHGIISCFIVAILSKIFNKKSVVSLHTVYRLASGRILSTIMKIIFFPIHKILVCAPSGKKELIGIGVPSNKIEIFTYWVNQKRFRPIDKVKCKKLLSMSDKFVFLFVGRFIESKGVPLILKTVSMIRVKNIAFVFAGDGPLEEDIKRASLKDNQIILLGKLNNENLPMIYNAADVLWGNPDIDYLGRVTIEGLFCGLPIIAPHRVNLFGVEKEVDLSAFDKSVITFIEPNLTDLSQKILYFYQHPESLENSSLKCREYATKHYSERNAKIIEDAYRR